MRSLKGAVKLTALLHELCSPDLASIHTGEDGKAFSQPEESMWPPLEGLSISGRVGELQCQTLAD